MEQLVTTPDIAAQQPQPRRRRRVLLATAALAAVGALALSACGGGSDSKDDKKGGSSTAKGADITISSKDGATDASINATGVKVEGGKLTSVKMTSVTSGAAVEGTISGDGSSWKPKAQLERGTKYKVTANAKDDKGNAATENATFTTVSSANSFIGTYTPDDGTKVGVGMPVSFTFDKAITEKKDVQSAITVTSSSGQKVVGHWFGNQRLDFRPQEYWKAGSKVTMKIALDGVKGANGATGVQNKTVTFTIGRAQVSTVDAKSHQMTVERDGKVIKTIPISAGSPQNPTYNGKMVISEKFTQTRMNGSTVGFGGEYDIKDVPHAMRLSTSGTFIHGNYWGAPFGSGNTSHGCVGLRDAQGAGDPSTPGAWFFNNSLIGDVVTVKGSPDKTIAPDNGLNGWNMSWSQWTAGSAV
ncbi:Ig-like domain-containing protein [Streptomyces flavofungini]|nr:Ig-like domain-containing protein [Streptomyces flavofungini]WJV48150.1 Ig-like domain-containing protein [Streptomyces flavofungini]